MAIKNTNLSPLLKEGTGIALTSAGQVITITSTGAGALPAGSDTQVQFNDAGVLGADAGLTYNKTLNILGLEAIDFAVTPTAGTAERRLLWDNDEGSLNLTLKGGATNIALGAEVAIMSYNAEATTLNKGEVVYLYGAQGQRPSVKRAVNTSDATSATTFGMVAESIASGATGFVMQMGIVRNIDTNAYNEGDILYLGSTAGSVTTTKPSAPAHMVFVGVVLKKNASSGRIFVKPQNGYELDEIHNVAISSITNNDFLVYESSSTLWKNKSISTVLGYTPEQPLTFSSPLSRSTNTISIPVATSLANGYLSSSDFATFSGKQNALSGTGIVKSTSGTISYLTDNSTNWDTAYTNRITSLTTTGSSGASTLVSNTLNIPNYTLAGLGGFANPMTTLGDIIYQNASSATRLAGSTSASKVFLSQTGTGTASAAPAWSAVSKSDVGLGSVENTALSTWAGSTNVTTLGTIGTGTWSASTIAVDKGGTGATTLTGVVIGSGTSAFTAVAGTASQLLRRNAGNTAYEFFTPTYLTSAITSLNSQTGATQTFSNDVNITITSATNTHTLGWSGQLSITRGGTGASTKTTAFNALTPNTTLGDISYHNGTDEVRLVGNITTTKQYLSQTGTGTVSAAPSWATISGSDITGSALTKTDDTNVTLTLGGTPSTALLRAASLTLGWTGQLSVARGGTGLSALGTANQLIRVNAGATALEYFTPSYLTSAITSLGGLTGATQTFANDTNVTITSATSTHTLGWTGQLSVGRGGTGASTLTGVLIGNGTSAVTAITGTASQLLRRNAGNTAYEFFTFSGMTNPMTTLGDIIYEDATPAPARLAGNITTTKQYLSQTGTGTISAVPAWSAIAGSDVTGSALTKTDDTNVTLTLGGTPATSLLRATSLTLGWTGQLAVSRGGTGLSALGTANQLIRVNAGATALEYFTPTYLTNAITSLGGLTASSQTFANDTNITITSATSTHTLGWSGQLSISRGGTGVSSVTTTPTASAFAGWDANSNLSADNFLLGYSTTATSGVTTTLVVGSTYYQYFTGTSTQTIVLPVVTTLVNGFAFRIVNLSTGNITINTSGGNAVQVMGSNTQLFVYVINTAGGTGTASWDWNYSIVKNANLPATIAGATTTNALAKFNSTGGLIADSNIIDNGTLIQLNVTSYHTGGVYNSSFYGSQSGIDISPVTWLGTSGTTNANFALNYSSVLKTLGVNNDYVSVPILTRSITEASSGTHNLFSQVAIQALSLTNGVATTTNSATLYVEGATTGTATITNNYAVWVDDGVTRLDGTAIINGSDATTNSVKSAGYFQGSLTTGTPAVGIGTSFGLNTQTAAGTYKLGSILSSISTNVTSTTEAFDLAFANMTGGATATERMRLKSTGQLQLNAYTTGTTFSGTPVGTLMTTSAGNVIIQESSLQFTSLNISATQVNSAFTTPVTLVSSPGAGKIIVPHTLVFFLNSAGTAFATNTNYGWMLGATLISATKSFAGTTDFYNIDTPTLTNGGTAVANAPLQWKVQTGNSTLGTGATISIGVVYSILSVS